MEKTTSIINAIAAIIGIFIDPVIIYSMFITFLLFFIILVKRTIDDTKKSNNAAERVLKAEQEAFKDGPEIFAKETEALLTSTEHLESESKQLRLLIEKGHAALQVGKLFDLYNKQIEKYQIETQSRAGWSFLFAITAMFAGLGFVLFGGYHVINNPGWDHAIAGCSIAAIGGAVGSFITKTFLDVHKLSLSQLNHYFRQPVLNAHILNAQRIADQIDDKAARQVGYLSILNNVVALIKENTTHVDSIASESPTSTFKNYPDKSSEPTTEFQNSAGAV